MSRIPATGSRVEGLSQVAGGLPIGLPMMMLATVSLLAGCIDEDLLNPMAHQQPRVNAYKPSEFYDDGQAMRHPPEGTVPRERFLGDEVIRTGRTRQADGTEMFATEIPLQVDAALMAVGQKQFNITCGTCHGPAGDGDSIVARQMALRPPPSLHLYSDRPPGYIYEVITKGFGLMASYAAQLSIRQRWAVVAYVRALQLSQMASLEDVPAGERERLEKETQ